jgi:hypothetical protein
MARYATLEAVMLIEIWERLRGYDKWISTDAIIESSRVTSHHSRSVNFDDSSDALMWTDRKGERHRDSINVRDDSPLYQLVEGATIQVRFNPDDPEKYYLRELLQTRVNAVARRVAIIFLIAVIITVAGWLRAH